MSLCLSGANIFISDRKTLITIFSFVLYSLEQQKMSWEILSVGIVKIQLKLQRRLQQGVLIITSKKNPVSFYLGKQQMPMKRELLNNWNNLSYKMKDYIRIFLQLLKACRLFYTVWECVRFDKISISIIYKRWMYHWQRHSLE